MYQLCGPEVRVSQHYSSASMYGLSAHPSMRLRMTPKQLNGTATEKEATEIDLGDQMEKF